MATNASKFDHAYGTLAGLAIGDALGMPSQTLKPEEIRQHYGQITGFVAPFADHPVSHGLAAGQITDDTEQTLLLARRLIDGNGQIDEWQLAQDLLAWEADIRARGLRDLLGPSTKAALDAMLEGKPITEMGKAGTTNGAAMRIAPIGLATPIEPLAHFVDKVELACRMTHNTGEAIAGAAAVAAIISCGLDGASYKAATRVALMAAQEGQKRGHQIGEGNMTSRIEAALAAAERKISANDFANQIGTSVETYESVATAFGLVSLAGGDPWKVTLMAANVGGDTDTIGSIAGAMAGACSGISAFPQHALPTILSVNSLPLKAVARDLIQLRDNMSTTADLQESFL